MLPLKAAILTLALGTSILLAVSCTDNNAVAPEPTTGAEDRALPTSDPDFSTWVAVGDWVRLRGCTVYDEPPLDRFDTGKRCERNDVIARIVDGPYGNGRDFPFYELEGIGWVNEPDFIDPVDGVSFVSASHGWAWNIVAEGDSFPLRVYETVDGGRGWEAIADLPYERSLFAPFLFVDDTHGWMHVGLYPDGQLLATDDGGRTWESVWKPADRYGGDWESYSFVSPERGWRTIPTRLERTDDGGRTWAPLTYPCDGERQYTAQVSFVSEAAGWILCGTTFGRDDFVLFRTSDAGDTWQPIVSTGPSRSTNSLGTGAVLIGLRFLDESRGWISTSEDNGIGGLYATSDGGLTWSEVAFGAGAEPPFWRFEPPDFVDELTAWMVVSRSNTTPGGLYRTEDGGATWALMQPPGDLSASN